MNKIGRYQLVEKLGQGGMGVVYRAFDPLLQRVVAVKLIGAIDANTEVRERFFREARAAGQLSHKNIITIHDLGEHEGQPFLAMEFLEGQDLQQRMAGHVPMSLARKLELAIEICEGIEYAHAAWRRAPRHQAGQHLHHHRRHREDPRLRAGAPDHLGADQQQHDDGHAELHGAGAGARGARRSSIGHLLDGVVLYEVLGGRKAFEGDSFGATLYKILQEVPEPLPNIDANLPPQLVAIVEHALEKSRDERYQQMSEMLRDLTAYRQQLMLIDSPAFGRPTTGGGVRVPSDSDAPTIAGRPATPLAALPPVSGQPASSRTPCPPRPHVPRRGGGWSSPAAATVVLLGALVGWIMTRDSPPPPRTAETEANAPADTAQQTIASQLAQASQALQAGDEAAAQRHADAVLAISPGHVEARRLRDSARQAAETVTRSLSNARDLFAAGRFDEASRAAGEVLAVDPDNAEARRLMDDGAARSRGKGADEARSRMARAKNAAAGAGAPTLAAGSYAAAVVRGARRLDAVQARSPG